MENKLTCPNDCGAERLLKMLSGKWKPQILRLAQERPLRYNTLLRQLEGSNRQALAVALRELEEQELLERVIVNQKPLHVEYTLSEKGHALIPVLQQLEVLSQGGA